MEDDLKKLKTNQSTKFNLIGCDTIVNSPSYLFSVNIKPSRHRFGFSLAWDWQYICKIQFTNDMILLVTGYLEQCHIHSLNYILYICSLWGVVNSFVFIFILVLISFTKIFILNPIFRYLGKTYKKKWVLLGNGSHVFFPWLVLNQVS